MKRLRVLSAIAALCGLSMGTVVACSDPVAAELGPDRYRTIELAAQDRAEHGDAILHGYVDAWFAGRPLHHWEEAHPDTLAEHGHEAVHAWIVTYWRNQWIAAYEANQAARAAAEAERARARKASSSTVWDRLAQCESGGNWSINTGNGYYGGLQFSLRSWRGVGGSGYPHQASRETQIAMGERLKANGGWGHWPACSRKLGLR